MVRNFLIVSLLFLTHSGCRDKPESWIRINLAGYRQENLTYHLLAAYNHVVYHDDYGDYVTDEPTMDGAASLIYLLGAKESGR